MQAPMFPTAWLHQTTIVSHILHPGQILTTNDMSLLLNKAPCFRFGFILGFVVIINTNQSFVTWQKLR